MPDLFLSAQVVDLYGYWKNPVYLRGEDLAAFRWAANGCAAPMKR